MGNGSDTKSPPLSIEERVLEHVHAVVFEIGVLLPGELAHAHAGIYPPSIQKFVPDLRNDYEFLAA